MNNGGEIAIQNPMGSFSAMTRYQCLYHLQDRNEEAKRIITEYAIKHATMDASLGFVGSWIPGAPLIITSGSVIAATHLIYKPMVERLSAVYASTPDHITDTYIKDATIMTAVGDLASQFGTEFLIEIAREILSEIGIGLIPTFIPFMSLIAGPLIDIIIAVTITWRIGTMTSLYFQNGESWIGDRKTTFDYAKDLTRIYIPNFSSILHSFTSGNAQNIKDTVLDTVSEDMKNQADFDGLRDKIPNILQKQIGAIIPMIQLLQGLLDKQHIKDKLMKGGIDEGLINLAFQQLGL